MQVVDERELLVAYQPGNPAASERIVRVYQNELLRTAFLLTGNQEEAVLLARESLLRLFRELLRGNAEDDGRTWLLGIAGRLFLSGEYLSDEDEQDGPPSPAVIPFQGGQPQRFHVEDERTRLLSALGRLDKPDRTGLVLREFNALDEEAVCRVLGEPPFDLRQRVHPARMRMRDAASVDQDYPVRDLLSTAATAAPRPNLWAEVETPLQALHAREEERRQRYAYGAGVLVLIVLLGGFLWLFDLLPFVSGAGEGDVAAVETATPAPPTPTPEPTPTPTPVPGISTYDIPSGNVPDHLLLAVWGETGGQDERGTALYDLETDSYIPLGPSDLSTAISPDGSLIFVLGSQARSSGLVPLMAMSTETGEMVWEVAVPAFTGVTATRDRLYIVGWERPHSLIALDIETGEEVGRWDDAVLGLETGFETVRFITLIAAPDGSRLFIAVEEYSEGPAILTSRTLASYELPGMDLESVSSQTDSTGSRQFPVDFTFSSSRPTPDGAYIYTVADDMVLFRNAHLNENVDLAIPFTPNSRSARPDLRWTTSNEGRYLYIIAAARHEVAVVDLLARSVVLVAPLDAGNLSLELDPNANVLASSGRYSGISLSADGRHLYLAGTWQNPESDSGSGLQETPVWVIDVALWQVVDRLDVRGMAWHISAMDEIVVHSTAVEFAIGQEYITTFDAETGEMIAERDDIALPEWIQGYRTTTLLEEYRQTYSRTPAINGVEPALVETESTLPRIEVSAPSETVPAGETVQFDVRFLNPAGGGLLGEARESVRFDPAEAAVIVRLYQEEGTAQDVVLIPNPVEPGAFEVLARLETDGVWGVQVTVTDAGGREWSIDRPRVLNVAPSFPATDGKRYIFRIETDPAEPAVDEDVAVRAVLVDIETGAALPEEVELVDGMPDRLPALFHAPGQGFITVALERQEDGSYAGENAFWEPGSWEAQVVLTREGRQVMVGAGIVTVVASS